MITNKAFIVCWWEFIERAKKKSYIIGLFVTPLVLVFFGAAPVLIQEILADTESEIITVYDGAGVLIDSLEATLTRSYLLENGKPVYEVRVLYSDGKEDEKEIKQRLDALVLQGKSNAALFIPANALSSLEVEYRAENVSNMRATERFERIISDLILEYRLSNAGIDPRIVRDLNRQAELRLVRLSEEGEKESGFFQSFGISYVFLIMLLIMVMTSGQMLVRSMVEEKSNRIVEILVSSCPPTDLMFGKIFGLSMLGLCQVVVWAVMAIIIILVAGITGLPLENIWLMSAYFILGFILYAAIFVAFGCLISTEHDAQQMTGYLSLLFTIPLIIAFAASQAPTNPILVALSMIPLFSPMMMIMRLPVITPPLWEIALSIGLLIITIVATVWIAAKIFRVGILLTGKRPTLDEIVRWIRS